MTNGHAAGKGLLTLEGRWPTLAARRTLGGLRSPKVRSRPLCRVPNYVDFRAACQRHVRGCWTGEHRSEFEVHIVLLELWPGVIVLPQVEAYSAVGRGTPGCRALTKRRSRASHTAIRRG